LSENNITLAGLLFANNMALAGLRFSDKAWKLFVDNFCKNDSVRKFDPSVEVPPGTVQRILEAAIRAPSAGNRQAWHFYIVRDAQLG